MTVRRATVNDRAMLTALYEADFGAYVRLLNPEIWRWKFLLQDSRADRLPFFVVEIDGCIAGGIGYVMRSMSCEGQEVKAVFPVDFFVKPSCRGLPSIRLLRAVLAEGDVAVAANLSEGAARLLKTAGFEDIALPLHGYHYTLPSSTVRQRWRPLQLLRSVALFCREVAAQVLFPSMQHRESKTFDAEFAAQCRGDPGAQVLVKDAQWAHWRYAQVVGLECVYLYQTRDGNPTMMLVGTVDVRNRSFVILDLLTRDAGLFSMIRMIDSAIKLAQQLDCFTVFAQARYRRLEAVLRLCLFGRSKDGLRVMVSATEPVLRKQLTHSKRWNFMLGDTDVY